ncbi:unnamed protein product [Brassica rapa]|uniref:Uncharacterized protein n=2 Tax=Brassica TaxID=3705 RepID=A0A8D9M7V9_BRACM|nr:unnamed protein product [Brassica napus]CAG7902107.1 unnamed protein product [Brassica rapa]
MFRLLEKGKNTKKKRRTQISEKVTEVLIYFKNIVMGGRKEKHLVLKVHDVIMMFPYSI